MEELRDQLTATNNSRPVSATLHELNRDLVESLKELNRTDIDIENQEQRASIEHKKCRTQEFSRARQSLQDNSNSL
jgi:hypothetical protein